MSIIPRIKDVYPGSQEGSEYVSAVRDFLFWCRRNRKNPVPMAVEGIRSTGHWLDESDLSGWTLLELIESIPEDDLDSGRLNKYSSHVENYMRVAGDGRDNAVQFFAELMNELGLEDLKIVLGESDRSLDRSIMREFSDEQSPGPVYHDEFYDRSEIESRFGDLTPKIMEDCAKSPDEMVDGKTLCEWIRNHSDEP